MTPSQTPRADLPALPALPTLPTPAGTLCTRVQSLVFGARGHVDVYQQYHYVPAAATPRHFWSSFASSHARLSAGDCGHDPVLAGWRLDPGDVGVIVEIAQGFEPPLRLTQPEARSLCDALAQILAPIPEESADAEPDDTADSPR